MDKRTKPRKATTPNDEAQRRQVLRDEEKIERKVCMDLNTMAE
jgi:hypothetical protein